jgi:hypothetical protein
MTFELDLESDWVFTGPRRRRQDKHSGKRRSSPKARFGNSPGNGK